MSALTELAAFVLGLCDDQPEARRTPCLRGVDSILTTPIFPGVLTRQAAMYGFALAIGATCAEGFDPAWKPAGCH